MSAVRTKWTSTFIGWIVAIGMFFPVFWMVLTSFKPESAAYSNPPKFVFHPTLTEYKQVFSGGMGAFLANSAIATVNSSRSPSFR